MRTMGGIRPPGCYGMAPFHQQEVIMDGPMGRNPPTFGGGRPGPFSNYSGPPPSLGGPPQRPPPSGIILRHNAYINFLRSRCTQNKRSDKTFTDFQRFSNRAASTRTGNICIKIKYFLAKRFLYEKSNGTKSPNSWFASKFDQCYGTICKRFNWR